MGEGNRVYLEKQVKAAAPIEITITDFKQAVIIGKCEDVIVVVKGKCNNVTIEGCKKTNILFDDVVSGVEVINCQKVNLQANGALNTLNIEKSAGVNVYLQTKGSQSADFITASATEVNLIIPGATEEADPK